MIVLDASAAVCVVLDSPLDRAHRIKVRLQGEQLHSPHLIDLEVANALRRLVQAGGLTAARAAEALDDLAHLPLRRHPHLPFLVDIWRLRDNYTAYDAAYLTLAGVLDVPLITLDVRMARAPSGASIEVF